MTDRDNRSKQGPGRGSDLNPESKSPNTGNKPSHGESEKKPGQSKQTQEHPSKARDSQGQSESGSPGSQGKTGNKKSADTEDETE